MSTDTTAKATFDGSGLGQWTESEVFEVTAERIAEYAAATNDPIPAHRAGDVAPPVFAVVPVFTSMAPAALEVAPVELLMRLVHGEQDFRFHRPIRPGDRLTARAKPTGYRSLATGSTVTVYAETRDAAGELVNEQYLTAFFRGVDAGPGEGEHAPGHGFDEALRSSEPALTAVQRIDEDQTFRYAPASGDPVPIHLDDELARMAGLPGIINHGLCTMAFTSWAVLTELAGGDTARLRRLAVRFARPVLPGQEIVTRAWHADPGPYSSDRARTYAYETIVDDPDAGAVAVIRDGLAVIADR